MRLRRTLINVLATVITVPLLVASPSFAENSDNAIERFYDQKRSEILTFTTIIESPMSEVDEKSVAALTLVSATALEVNTSLADDGDNRDNAIERFYDQKRSGILTFRAIIENRIFEIDEESIAVSVLVGTTALEVEVAKSAADTVWTACQAAMSTTQGATLELCRIEQIPFWTAWMMAEDSASAARAQAKSLLAERSTLQVGLNALFVSGIDQQEVRALQTAKSKPPYLKEGIDGVESRLTTAVAYTNDVVRARTVMTGATKDRYIEYADAYLRVASLDGDLASGLFQKWKCEVEKLWASRVPAVFSTTEIALCVASLADRTAELVVNKDLLAQAVVARKAKSAEVGATGAAEFSSKYYDAMYKQGRIEISLDYLRGLQ